MDLELKDKVIFVAGASRGIGLGIVEACLKEGAKLALTARGPEALEETRKRLGAQYGADRIWAMAGDMRETATIERALDEAEKALGPIFGVVANVGISPSPLGFEVDDETWAAGFAQNVDAGFRLARGALRRMTPRKAGSIVMISSIAGVDALGSPLTYGSAKAAGNHLAKELARLVGPAGVRVNVIAPGNIIFPGGDWEARSTGERADAWNRWVRREVPMQRFGKPEEIGDMAAFLLSQRASFVTGTIIPVDGGQVR